MSEIANVFLQIALIVLIALLFPCVYRVLIGPSPADRLQALETITTLLIGIIIVLAILQRSAFVIDVGMALAAFAFIATLAIARYLAEGRVF
ncbi:MAG: monovalent cation/H+ antiporter complex subunit F [bacterium]|nr:monovalent cation/H+ antiporter complex subunit F [bacterium]